jgi:hypothetical protein
MRELSAHWVTSPHTFYHPILQAVESHIALQRTHSDTGPILYPSASPRPLPVSLPTSSLRPCPSDLCVRQWYICPSSLSQAHKAGIIESWHQEVLRALGTIAGAAKYPARSLPCLGHSVNGGHSHPNTQRPRVGPVRLLFLGP